MIRSIIISLLLLSYLGLSAQTPGSFKYQTSVRDNTGKLLANKLVAFKISLLQGNENGTAVYVERHSIATNDFGVANFNIGGGTPLQGIFSNVDWGNGPYFLKIDLDLNNGTNYVFMGTSQLLSVPYALYAAKSANAADDKDKDSTNEIQNVTLTGNNLQLSKNGGAVDLSKYANDSQSLTLSGNTLSISRGNSVVFDDRDKDSTNEIQNLSLNGTMLSISKGNAITLGGVVDLDADPTNEVQTLSIIGDSLKISKGNGVKLPKDNDTDSTNELQSLVQNENVVRLTKDSISISVPKTSNIVNGSLLYANASGRDSLTLNLNTQITDYITGMIVNFKVPNTNTKNVVLRLNNLGFKQLYKNINTPLTANDLRINQMVSVIYDGQNFQFFVVPFANEAVNAQKFKNDTAGGLVPAGSLIETELPTPPSGYTATGKFRSQELDISIINSDSFYSGILYLDTFNNTHYFIKTKQINTNNCYVSFYRYDTTQNRYFHLLSQNITAQDSRYQFKLMNGKVYIFSVSGGGTNQRSLILYSYDISANQFQQLYLSSFSIPNTAETNYIDPNFVLINNSIVFRLSIESSNVFLNNAAYSFNFYRWNLSNGVMNTILQYEYTQAGLNTISNQTELFYISNDSIFQLNSSFVFLYKNKFGSSNKSQSSAICRIGNRIYYKDYIYSLSNNSITPRLSLLRIDGGIELNSKVLINQSGQYNILMIDNLVLTDLNLNNPVNVPRKELIMGLRPTTITRAIYINDNYIWAIGDNAIIFRFKMPKIFYQYVKN